MTKLITHLIAVALFSLAGCTTTIQNTKNPKTYTLTPEQAEAKFAALEAAGCKIARNPADMGTTLKSMLK